MNFKPNENFIFFERRVVKFIEKHLEVCFKGL